MESAFFLVEEDSVNEEAFASSIFSNDRNDTEFPIFREADKKLFCFLAELEAFAFVKGDEGDGVGRGFF